MDRRPLRVLHSLSAIASGGVEVRHRLIAQRLNHPSFEHRFVGTTGGQIADELVEEGITVQLLGPVSSVFAPRRYRAGLRLARSWRPDLIHGAVMEGSSLGVVLARRLGIPMIYEETSDPQNRRPLGHQLARVIGAGATKCVAVSPAVGDYLTDELRIPRRKVDVLVNGVRAPQDLPPHERSQLRASHGIQDQDIVVGTVSRLFNDHKRVTDLIEAFASIDPTRADLHLIIVGSGPDRPMMEAASAATGAGGKIHFVGRHVPADPYYAIMDVFALVSSREAFGLVAAEAMRAALPVIATRVGGLADIVEDGITGYLVPPRDPASIRLAMEALIDDKSKRTRMGDAGRRRAEENYSEERYLRDVEHLYLSLAEPRNGTRM